MDTSYNSTPQTSSRTRDLVISALLIALVFIATKFINIKLPFSFNDGGLIHTGNIPLFMAAIVFGRKKGAIAGAFGMGLFDILSGYAAWAPFTFVIRAVQGYIIGSIANGNDRNGRSQGWNLLAILVSSPWMIAGYYMTSVILYGNWLAPVNSIPGDIAQIVLGIAGGLPLAAALKRTKMF